MEELYNTSGNQSYGINYDDNTNYGCFFGNSAFILYVVTWIIFCIGLPLIIVAIIALYFLIRKDHVAPVYVINLLLSDLFQLCCMMVWVTDKTCENSEIFDFHYFGLMVSVGFMVCVSMERYLVIAHPLWYRYRRTIKSSVIISIVVWVFPLACVLPFYLMFTYKATVTMFSVFLLLPFPLLMFLMGGTLRALSSARSVPSDEKRRIVAILVVVLLIYTMLFLPSIIWSLTDGAKSNCVFSCVTLTLIQLSPLADLTMYVFIRKGAIDNVLSSLCCDKMDSDVDTQHE
ncbi:G-protein coupled receptor 4-like isoform X2 [Parambassis ranga]|uniref:G-protein coupled receptor 4-like isoform X2 n=1 Tax=Parambassis ranga TaxID=210632 RepID=A0A6P7JSM3_9TELE|nr:G-protein coupled receptor 4-like isoform X2 [Parambassis ranga]